MPIRFTRFLFVFIFCLAGIVANGQKIATFQKIYRSSGSNTFRSSGNMFSSDGDIFSSGVVSLPYGGFIISGIAKFSSTQVQTIIFSVHLLRVDSLGKILWSKTYRSPATDSIAFIYPSDQYVDLTLAPDGNVVIGTSTLEYPGGGLDPGYLFKIDLNGNVLWSNVYHGTSNSPYAYSKTSVTTVVNNPKGGYLLGGMVAPTDQSTGLYPLPMVIKTDATGSVIWAKGYGNGGGICTIVPSRDGGIILSGSGSDNSSNNAIIKTDNNGNPKWIKRGFYSLAGTSTNVNAVIELPDKSIYAFSSGFDNHSPYTFSGNIQKLDSTGVLLWSKQYDFGLTGNMVVSSSKGLLYNGIFGYAFYDSTSKNISVSLKNIGNGIGIMRIDTSGKVIFSKIYDNVYNNQYYHNPSHWFEHLSSGGFALLGATNALDSSHDNNGFDNGGDEYFLVKADKNANTAGCNTRSLIPKVSNFPVYISSNTITATSLSLSSDSFYSVSNYAIKDSVVCSPFVANFGADSVCFGITTSLHDSTYFKPTTWYWDFGDTSSTGSDTSTLQNPTHQYKYPGTYYAKLVASNGTETDSITKKIKVYPLPASQLLAASKISTSTTNGSVIIRWTSPNKRNLAYNELFFSGDGVHFDKLNGPLANGGFPPEVDSFVQSGLDTKDSDYEYYLVTYDSCNAQSVQSLTHKTMTLTVSVGELLHKLNWTPYKGFKVEEYVIQKLINGSFQPYDTVPGTDTSTRFFPAPCNHIERYRIEAVGSEPAELSLSDTMGRKAIDTIPPNAAKITSLVVSRANNVQLNFISSDSLKVYTYLIERAVNGKWGTASDFITHLHGEASSFTDTINTASNNLCYTIITLDSCLNTAESDTIYLEPFSTSALACKAQVSLLFPKPAGSSSQPDSFIVQRSIDKNSYSKINELPASATTDIDTNVIAGKPYYYKIESVYSKDGMVSYSDTQSAVPRIIPDADSAQLVYATVIKSDETNGSIYIAWKRTALNDTNARGYYVYSLNTANGKYALIKDITDLNDTSYIQDNINTIKNAYQYYIITYNVCDVGINSNIHRTVLLRVQNNNLNEQLNWLNYLGIPVRSYSVYKSEDGGVQNLVNNAGLDSAFSDSNITCNHNYTYQIQAMLANGEISFSDSITVKSFDTVRPKTGPIIVATVVRTGIQDGRIELDWSGAIDKELDWYNIYRSIDGLYWSLIIDHWPGTSLIDTGLDTYDQAYYYKIQPVDSCGNLGPFTIYHRTIYQRASAKNGYNQINWNSYAGWKVRQYLVYKNGVLIDSLANNVFAFKDTLVICNTSYQYLIKAIDSANDTIISASNTDSAKALNHIPPQRVYIKTVTVSKPNKAATISWTPSSSYDVKNYFIFRKAAATGYMIFIDSTTNLSYIDSNHIDVPPLGVGGLAQNSADEGDCYYVFARDHCGNQSDGSNQGCIIILNVEASGASTSSATGGSAGSGAGGYNELSWNSYRDWYDSVQSYNVYKNEDSTGWQLIGTTSPPAPLLQRGEFTDNKLGDSTIDFCYQVEAMENPGQYNQLSRSTVECVHQDATVFIPNTFTPYDQDGLNDYFGPIGSYVKNYSMKIYNRWGELVYNSNTSKAWDGTSQGQFVQQGVYIYLITVTDYNGKQSYFKGTITMFE